MKRLLIGALAAWITVSCWATGKENAKQDRYGNRTILAVYDNGSELITKNVKVNASGHIIVDASCNTFTVGGSILEAIRDATQATEGIGNTHLAEAQSQSLQLGVLEGGVTTGVAHAATTKDAAVSINTKIHDTGASAQEMQGTYTSPGQPIPTFGKFFVAAGRNATSSNGAYPIEVSSTGVIAQGQAQAAGGSDGITSPIIYQYSDTNTTGIVPNYNLFYDDNTSSWARVRGSSGKGTVVDAENTTIGARQVGTWNIAALTGITNPVTVWTARHSGGSYLPIRVSPGNGVISMFEGSGDTPADDVSNAAAMGRMTDQGGASRYLGIMPYYFDENTWDRFRGSAEYGLVVDARNTTSGARQVGSWDVGILSDQPLTATTDTVGSTDRTDKMLDGTTLVTPKYALIDAAASGNNTLVAAVADKKIRVLDVVLIASGAVVARFESGASGTALTGQMELSKNGGFAPGFSPVGHFETATNTLLNLELDSTTSVDGWLVYIEVD